MDDSSSSDLRQDGSAAQLAGLFDTPEAWQALEPERLRALLFYGWLRCAVQPQPDDPARLTAIHHLACATLTASVRYAVVSDLGRALERVVRAEPTAGQFLDAAFRPFLMSDPDPAVVCAAATEVVSLLPSSGAAMIVQRLAERPDVDGRAGLIAGLLQAADSSVEPLLAGSWRLLGLEGQQTLALVIQSFHRVTRLTVSFLLRWVVSESADAEGASFGIAAATLARSGRHALKHGVTDAGTGQEWTGSEFAGEVEKRLASAWRDEVPALLPGVLEAWGLEEAALDAALIRAWQQVTAGGARQGATFVEPIPIDVVPDWEPESASALEWGRVASSPRLETLHVRHPTWPGEEIAPNTVWPTFLLHAFYSPDRVGCSVVAAWRDREDLAVEEAIEQLIARQAASGYWAPASGPSYLHIPPRFGVGREVVLRRLVMILEQAAGVDADHARGEAGEWPPGTGDVRGWLQEIAAPDRVRRLREEMVAAWDRTLESDE